MSVKHLCWGVPPEHFGDHLQDAARGFLRVREQPGPILMTYVMSLQARQLENGAWGLIAHTAIGRELTLIGCEWPDQTAATAFGQQLVDTIISYLESRQFERSNLN